MIPCAQRGLAFCINAMSRNDRDYDKGLNPFRELRFKPCL